MPTWSLSFWGDSSAKTVQPPALCSAPEQGPGPCRRPWRANPSRPWLWDHSSFDLENATGHTRDRAGDRPQHDFPGANLLESRAKGPSESRVQRMQMAGGTSAQALPPFHFWLPCSAQVPCTEGPATHTACWWPVDDRQVCLHLSTALELCVSLGRQAGLLPVSVVLALT